jgi:hypothetical protein
MLNLFGPKQRFCDGISRRNFLKIGGLAMGGLGLSDILRLEAQAGQKSASHKAIIMIFLPGGPPHQDMVDLKPDAPKEFRGEFKPIDTKVPGIQVCEHLPRLAGMMDKLTIIRSIVGCRDEHASDQCLSGYTPSESRLLQGGRPSLGSILAKLEGPVDKAVPPFVGLAPKMDFAGWANPGGPGFLGRGYAPFRPEGDGIADMTLKGVSTDQLRDRKALLQSFDSLRRDIDAAGTFEALDAFNQRALDVLTSSKLVEALDVTREEPRLRDRYGIGSSKNVDDGGPCWNDQFVIARRLVEAGVRCVTLAFGRWDYHGNNFGQCKERLPKLDQALSALVQDLHDRGLDQDVSVVAWGEFGRTPRINKDAGRDHWAPVSCALLACGGMKMGQVIGSTNHLGEYAKDRPVHMQEVFATLYHQLGIDVKERTIVGPSGRPVYLLDKQDPLQELI